MGVAIPFLSISPSIFMVLKTAIGSVEHVTEIAKAQKEFQCNKEIQRSQILPQKHGQKPKEKHEAFGNKTRLKLEVRIKG